MLELRAHEMVREKVCLEYLVITQLFVDVYGNSVLTMILRSIDDDVLIDIYTNTPLAQTKSLSLQCCLLRSGRTPDDFGQHECQKQYK